MGSSAPTLASSWRNLRRALEMIKIEHSVFALPFALLGALFAADGWPTARQLFWIVVAMVAARSAAMTFNRLVDRDLDAANPRTRGRALASGALSSRFAWVFFAASAAVFVLAAASLNRLTLELSPVALAWVLFYSYTKRFTWLSHLALGAALGIAPAAAWIAVRGSLAPRILPLCAAVTLWVAGFDILYACQDFDFDRAHPRLRSIPKRLGIRAALRWAAVLHATMLLLLAWLLWLIPLGWLGVAGLAAVAGLIAYEHSLVKPDDLSRLDAAFFTVNGYIGILLLATWGAAIVWR